MCIKSISAFEDSKGTMFKDEKCAIQSEIGIVTGFELEAVMTLIAKASPLIPLLQRVLAIAPPSPKVKAVSAEPTPLSPEKAYERRAALLGRLHAWAQIETGKIKSPGFITAGGYINLKDLNERASDEDVERMHVELDALGVA